MLEGLGSDSQLMITDLRDSMARFAFCTQVRRTIPQSGNRLKRNNGKLF